MTLRLRDGVPAEPLKQMPRDRVGLIGREDVARAGEEDARRAGDPLTSIRERAVSASTQSLDLAVEDPR